MTEPPIGTASPLHPEGDQELLVAPPPVTALPVPDAQVHRRTVGVVERVAELMGWGSWEGRREFADFQAAIDALDLASGIVSDRIEDLAGSGDGDDAGRAALVLVEVEAMRRELRERVLVERYEALVGVQAGLARLRGIGSASAMLDKATEEVCRSCGFDRSILFRVLDSQMVAVSVYYRGDPEGAARLLEVGSQMPADLNHMLLETEMIRRRMAMLVPDAQHDPRVHQAIAIASGSTSYVAAPIMPEGRVIGFLHADRHFQRRPVDEYDRQMLWTFAEGFGYAFEGTVLLERIHAQREQVRQMISSTDTLMDELCDTEAEVTRITADDSSAVSRAAAMLTGDPSRLDQLLTRREVEVIRLMATGETNAGIADRLVISEGTVKSHVKHILRKLRAANRAEAVSRYMRITALDT